MCTFARETPKKKVSNETMTYPLKSIESELCLLYIGGFVGGGNNMEVTKVMLKIFLESKQKFMEDLKLQKELKLKEEDGRREVKSKYEKQHEKK